MDETVRIILIIIVSVSIFGLLLFVFVKNYMKRKIELDEINNALDYLIKNKSVTGEILTLDSGQSLGWANSKSKVFSTD